MHEQYVKLAEHIIEWVGDFTILHVFILQTYCNFKIRIRATKAYVQNMLNIGICFSRLQSILKVIRCKCKTGTDAACRKRCSCRKNGLFCVMACGQYQEEECSNESNSSIIDDMNGYNNRNVFDAFASFW